MASITKLMTAIVALEHASLDDVATISSRHRLGRRVDDQSPSRRASDGRRADSGRADPERERRRECDRGLRRTGLGRPVRRADERPRAGARPDRHPLLQPGRARRARSLLERPRRHEAGTRRDEQALRPPDGPARRGRGGGQAPAHVERPALDLPEPDRRQDRPYERRRLVGGRRRPPRRCHDLRHPARGLEPRRAERRSRGTARVGTGALPDGVGDRRRPDVRNGANGLREARGASRRRESRRFA